MTDETLQAALEWVTGFDLEAQRASVEALRRARPAATQAALVEAVFRGAGWRFAAVGTLMGLPTSLLLALPVAAVEQIVGLRFQAAAAAQAALIYDPHYFDRPASRWELLKPILAINTGSNVLAVGGMLAAGGAYELLSASPDRTLGAAARVSGAPPRTVGSVIFAPLRLTDVKRRALLRAIPIAGGVIGGVWNWYEMRLLEWHVIRYFEGETQAGLRPQPGPG